MVVVMIVVVVLEVVVVVVVEMLVLLINAHDNNSNHQTTSQVPITCLFLNLNDPALLQLASACVLMLLRVGATRSCALAQSSLLLQSPPSS
jgi:hypothetical protein